MLAILLYSMVINKLISKEEADTLQKKLGHKPVPKSWREAEEGIYKIIGRSIIENL